MRNTGIFGLLALCSTAAFAAQHNHHHHKRYLVTEIKTITKVDVVTKTVIAGSAPSADDYVQENNHAAEVAPSSSSSHAAYVPPPSSSSTYVPVPAAPSPAANKVAPQKAPAPPVKAAPVQSPPSNGGSSGGSSSGGSAPSGNIFHGDVTYYTAEGLSTCGYTLSNTNNTVAIQLSQFHGLSNYGTGQPASPLCNKKINLYPNGLSGKSVELIVADGCSGCGQYDLDLPQGFFESTMPSEGSESNIEVGRFTNIAWEWA